MKTRNFITLFLMVSVILSTSFVWAQDTTPPELVSIDVSPTSIDVSTGPADITVTVHLTDDLSGVATWSTTFSSPSGTQSLQIGASSGLVGGASTDGTFEGTNTLPQGSEEGPWVAVIVTVVDVEGNSQDIDLSAYGVFLIQVGTTVADLTPPDVFEAEVSVTPTLLYLTSGDGIATVQAHLTDDLSGVKSLSGAFVSPSGVHSVPFEIYDRDPVSGDRLDGTFEAEAFFPQFSEPGVWRPRRCYESIPDPPGYREFDCIYVRDRVGNEGQIDLEAKGINLEVTIIAPSDLTPPDVFEAEVSVTPTLLYLTSGDGIATVQAHLTDDLSGVISLYGLFVSPSGVHSVPFEIYDRDPVSGDRLDGTFEAEAFFPQFSEPGVWRPRRCYESIPDPPGYREFDCIYVRDRVGNEGQIDLEAKGINLEVTIISPVPDFMAPELQSFSVSPSVMDISEGDGIATVQAHLTDDLSGVISIYGVFVSPSGVHHVSFESYDRDPVSGDRLDGTFELEAFFPQFSEPGVWRPRRCYESIPDPPGYREFPCIYVRDRVGNQGQIDLRGGGFPLQIGVISVPPELIFAIEPFSDLNPINTSHTLTITLSQDSLPVQEVEVKFELIRGPHSGVSGSALTDGNGQASFTYTGTIVGVDTIIASVDINNDGEVDAARQATKEWEEVSFIEVQVDIKPGSDPNCIKVTKKGGTPVAFLSSVIIDSNTIDVSTIQIDSDDVPGGGVSPVKSSARKDVNGDGLPDLVAHFSTQQLNIAGLLVDDNTLYLTGTLMDGTAILGSDIINLAGGPYCFD